MKTTCIKALLAVVCLSAIPGCGDKADTPVQALENMRLAMLDGNKQAFLDCYDVSGKQAEVVSAFYDFTTAARKFDESMRKAYGDDAVTQAMIAAKDMSLENDKWIEDATVQIDGDTATVTLKGQPQPMRLINKNGLWKIDATSMLGATAPSGQDIEQQIKMFQALTKAVTDVQQKIGQPGYTAEKVSQELAKATRAAMIQAVSGSILPNLSRP